MGAISFSLDERLVEALKIELPLKIFVETGTFRGDSLGLMLGYFDRLFSVEQSDELWRAATDRFKDEPKVRIVHSASPQFLSGLSPTLAEATLYWLDAHWCVGEATAGERSQCPLLDELVAIGSLNAHSVVLIDDARLFLAPPGAPHETSQWPRFHEIVRSLLALSPDHEIMVVNDVIAFFPRRARQCVEAYAKNWGVDWFEAAICLREGAQHLKMLQEKEAIIQSMASSLLEKEEMIQKMSAWLIEKESVIQGMARSKPTKKWLF